MAPVYCKITAIVRVDMLQRVEKALKDMHVSGVSISRVKGYGEYADFFARDWMSPYARVEVFTSAERALHVADVVACAASTGTRGDGIVAVEDVTALIRTRSRAAVPQSEL